MDRWLEWGLLALIGTLMFALIAMFPAQALFGNDAAVWVAIPVLVVGVPFALIIGALTMVDIWRSR